MAKLTNFDSSVLTLDDCSLFLAEYFVPGNLYEVCIFSIFRGQLFESYRAVMLATHDRTARATLSGNNIVGVNVETGQFFVEDRENKLYVIRNLKEPITLENE